MPKICYDDRPLSKPWLAVIDQANQILEEYAAAGYDLTLRQLYYQFVAKALIPNESKQYDRLGSIISAGRRAGLIDWSHIVDRTRFIRRPPAWSDVPSIVQAVAEQFDIDWWKNQPYRPEVWIEKDALVGVLEVACDLWHVPYFSCRGYVSDSEIWSAAQRFRETKRNNQTPLVFHLGDHDPSGIDMTRDIADRLALFSGIEVEVRRLALTMAQVEEHEPPPNPAKVTDSRYQSYADEYGEESWELDALDPDTLAALIEDNIEPIIKMRRWQDAERERDEGREQLSKASDQWGDVVAFLEDQ